VAANEEKASTRNEDINLSKADYNGCHKEAEELNSKGRRISPTGFGSILAEDYRCETSDRAGIIITCVGSIGRVALVDSRVEFSADRSLAIVRPSIDKLIPEYGFYLLRSPQIQRQFVHASIGTAQSHLYLKELRGIKVKLPSIAEQETQLEVLRKISASKVSLGQRVSTLVLMRGGVLNSIGSDAKNV
jgi:hypothetical protein